MVGIAEICGVIGIVEYDIRKVMARRLGGFPEFVRKNDCFLVESFLGFISYVENSSEN